MKKSLSVEADMAVWRAAGSGGGVSDGSGWKVIGVVTASCKGAAGRRGWDGEEGLGRESESKKWWL